MSAVAAELRDFLEHYIPLIEQELFSFLPVQEPEEFMYRPMRDYPERGGKRSRPALVLLSCATVGGDVNKALRTAAAFELFQSFALLGVGKGEPQPVTGAQARATFLGLCLGPWVG